MHAQARNLGPFVTKATLHPDGNVDCASSIWSFSLFVLAKLVQKAEASGDMGEHWGVAAWPGTALRCKKTDLHMGDLFSIACALRQDGSCRFQTL